MKRLYNLVHGTSARHLPSILKNGLQPRGERESQWRCASNPRMVYLSAAYGLYYAINAAKYDDDCLLVEVEVEPSKLYPGEDYVAQAAKPGDLLYTKYPSLIKRTAAAIEYVQKLHSLDRIKLALESINYMGNACHEGAISPRAIKRIAIIPADDIGELVMRGFDPVICIENFTFMGNHYMKYQKILLQKYARAVA